MERPGEEIEIHLPPIIDQYERKIYDLRQIIEISKGLSSTLEYNILIDSILLTCMGHMQLIRAGIFLKKGIESENYVFHRNYKGFDVDHTREYEIESNAPLVKYLESNPKCITLNDAIKLIDDGKSLQVLKLLNPCLIVPLVHKATLNGIIILGERINLTDFTESEKEFLLEIASLAGIAVHNAALYEMATTDMMTKLKIHHYFKTLIIDEMDRAKRLERPLSLIMADLDNFKNVNDTYGHQAGDEVLIHVAKIIKESIRQIDVASRYGGEEFAIILPSTDINEALVVGERIRQNVERLPVVFEHMKLPVTLSIGITQYDPGRDLSSEDIIGRADRALYQSKAAGKNTVSFL